MVRNSVLGEAIAREEKVIGYFAENKFTYASPYFANL